MNEQVLKNKQGKLIGKIKTLSDGKQEIRNSSGKRLGVYDPKSNKTKDANGRSIGSGNLLTTLLLEL